jgi:4-aminobutyrate aminotransferase / (S)-3-amino-2-methylpropionate transaminase / 5-aminovalerate transaminase
MAPARPTEDPTVTIAKSIPGQDDADELEALDRRYVMRPWSHPAGEPVIVASANNCVVTDIHGKQYLDFTAGYFVNNAGHCHPRIVEAATQQMHKVLQVSGKHGTVAAVRLAERLIQLAPRSVDKAFFATGGSEANEFALKLARQSTGKTDVAYLENGYHGLTLGALEVTHSEPYRKSAGRPLSDTTYALPNAYCYRCTQGKTPDDCAAECLDGVEDRLKARPQTAAIIAEPIQAVGGLAPPPRWWQRVDEIRRKLGILLIADEIQTGLGRTGKMFAVEHYGLEPEILTAGKGLSGGVGSLAVACGASALCQTFFGGTTPTSGGNAVSAAAGLEMIEVLFAEGLIDNAARMGQHFSEAVTALDDPWVGDVRFHGLLGGVELVADRATKAVLGKTQIGLVKDGLHAAGMLITVSGTLGNVLRLQPPLTVTAGEIDQFVAALRKTLQSVRQGG